ncbi:MAG TPA: lysozyme inhibitor LprI family protein [Burkholderiales bacterium]
MKRAVTALLLGLLWSAAAAAASFPCEKAQSRVEKAICADAEVSQLDEYLGRYYSGARAALRDSTACLAADQRQWLSSVRNACQDTACLKKAYLERLAELHAIQPGASSLRNVALPSVPSLVWIIPPAADNVAAPPRPGAKPLVARGRVVNDLEKGDGFVLRTAEGATHILLLTMFFDGSSVDVLTVLARDPAATFLARGHAAANSRGEVYYEPSRCVFLYRIAG